MSQSIVLYIQTSDCIKQVQLTQKLIICLDTDIQLHIQRFHHFQGYISVIKHKSVIESTELVCHFPMFVHPSQLKTHIVLWYLFSIHMTFILFLKLLCATYISIHILYQIILCLTFILAFVQSGFQDAAWLASRKCEHNLVI